MCHLGGTSLSWTPKKIARGCAPYGWAEGHCVIVVLRLGTVTRASAFESVRCSHVLRDKRGCMADLKGNTLPKEGACVLVLIWAHINSAVAHGQVKPMEFAESSSSSLK
jgi:hypothetical protein